MRSERGQSLVEYALILPVLMILLVGIMEFALVALDYATLSNAAREGARAAAVVSTDADARSAAVAAAERAAVTLDDDELSVIATVSADTVQVRVEYDVHLITAALVSAVGGQPTLHLQAVSTMRRE